MPAKICEVCAERTAMYLCQKCGSSLCPVCRVGWFCMKCSLQGGTAGLEARQPLRIGPFPLVIVAVATIVGGFALVLIGSGPVEGSTGCFFWPFPLVVSCGIGSGGVPTIAMLALLGLVGVMLVFWLVSVRWARLP